MPVCPSCARDVSEGRFCNHCGANLVGTFVATQTSAPDSSPYATGVSDASGGSRFVPGAMVAGRYRVVGLIGRGGMGEVYRADDLKLGQPVALKFLPQRLEQQKERLDRFLNEVKVALRVTHPNVCRVYDIGEVDGQHFISMEYIDGEDLASLLRRIGRLPEDKAVQIARQLCAGLAAAHDEGILHRDFKPANVMIDGRGRAKITDFGLAGLADAVAEAEIGAGTPAYMAPEQAEGREVSVRSDVYALGLVLYELFTGKRAFDASDAVGLQRQRNTSTPTSPVSLVAGLDPAIERAILRCLEREPQARAPTPLAVAASLPGGDPLAAALAAGETPSPEMVAAAGDEGALRPRVAVACVAFLAVMFVLFFLLSRNVPGFDGMFSWAQVPHPPQVLEQKAVEMLERLGYDEPVGDTALGAFYYTPYLDWIEDNVDSRDRWARLRDDVPPSIFFWYRSSPGRLVPELGSDSGVGANNPVMREPGEARVHLTPEGRLDHLRIVPRPEDTKTAPSEMDWQPLLRETGLDLESLRSVEPRALPPDYADARAAWEGHYPGRPDMPLLVEAAAFAGRPVSFWIREPWEQQDAGPISIRGLALFNVLFTLIVASIIVAGVLLARRNLRVGRGDRAGAVKIAIYALGIGLLEWVITTNHSTNVVEELELFLNSYSATVFLAGMTWLVYVALEPFLRSRWPTAMISWNRLLAGHFRDPRVGRDILVGICGGHLFALVGRMHVVACWLLDQAPPRPDESVGRLGAMLGGTRFVHELVGAAFYPLVVAGALPFLLLVLRVVLRRHWIAVAALGVLLSLPPAGYMMNHPLFPLFMVFSLLLWMGIYLLLARFGVVSLCFGFATLFLWDIIPSLDFSSWYAGNVIVVILVLAAIAAYAFYTSLGGRSVFSDPAVPGE